MLEGLAVVISFLPLHLRRKGILRKGLRNREKSERRENYHNLPT